MPIPEREAAKAAGERFYFTGIPCKNGHIAKRYTGTGNCSKCSAANTKRTADKKHESPERMAARLAGLIHYRATFECVHGHGNLRYVSNNVCTTCSSIKAAKQYRKNPELSAAKKRAQRKRNPHPHREASRKWAKNNPENVRAATLRTYTRDPELWRKRRIVYVQNRKAREKANGGSFTDEDIELLFLQQKGRCKACKRSDVKLTIDHIVALINGGSNDPSNLQLLCRRCNQSKGRKNFEDWLRESGHYTSFVCELS